MLGAITLNSNHIVQTLDDLSLAPPNQEVLRECADASLQQIRQGTFPGVSWLLGLLDSAVQNARLRVGPDLMLFRKSLHTLQGVIHEVGSIGFPIDEAMVTEFVKQFTREWPRRWLTMPNSKRNSLPLKLPSSAASSTSDRCDFSASSRPGTLSAIDFFEF